MASEDSHAEPKEKPAPPPRRHRGRRWAIRIGVFLIGTILLIGIIVQIILWTSFPQSIVVTQVEEGLGLRLAVKSLSTSWLGHTSMHDVKIALPLSPDQSFFEVSEMKVSHTNLLGLALGWPIEIKRLELVKPVLYVRQNAAGKWNLQEVAALLLRTGGQKTGEQTQTTLNLAQLPELQITDMTVIVLDNKGRQARVEPININGTPQLPVWKYDVEIPSQQPNAPAHLSVLGLVAPGALWAHTAQIFLNDPSQWLRPWFPSFNQSVAFDGKWSGQLTANGVGGFLQIKDSHVGLFHADGDLGAAQSGSSFTITPDNLRLSMTPTQDPNEPSRQLNVTVPAGRIDYDGKVARATQVQLALLGGPAIFNGWFEPDLRQGALEAYWQNMAIPGAHVTQSGKLNATYSQPIAAPIQMNVVASSSGTAPQGTFDAVMKANATGQNFKDIAWNITTPQLAYYRPPQPVILNGLTAAGTWHRDAAHELVRLDRISLPADNRLAGNGSFDLLSKQGEIHIEGQDWPVHLIEGTKLAFVVDASGQGVPSNSNPKKTSVVIDLTQFLLRSGDANLKVSGHYDSRKPKPIFAQVAFENTPGAATQVGEPTLIKGDLAGKADLSGTLSPRSIEISGSLTGRNAQVLGHALGNITTKLAGFIDDDKATIRGDGIPFLDGIWNLGATYVIKEADKPVYATTVDISVDRLPLQKASEFLQSPPVSGTFNGHWYVYFPGLKPDPQKMAVTGGGSIRNLAASYLVADEMSFNTTLQNGKLKIDPIKITRGNYGRIDAQAEVDMNNWREIRAGISFTAFPIDLPPLGASVQLFGGAVADSNDEEADPALPITIFLPNSSSKDPAARILRADAGMNVRTVVSIMSKKDANGRQTMQPVGEVRTKANVRGRVVDLTQINGDLLGGTLTASGVTNITDLDHILHQTKIEAAWKDLQTEEMVRLYPGIKGTGGTISGRAEIQPAASPRALEPLAIDVYSKVTGGHWRTVELGNAELHAFLGPNRLITSDTRPSSVQIARGSVDLWFTSAGHADTTPLPSGKLQVTGTTISNQLNVMLNGLDMDQFVAAFDPAHARGLGRLFGSVFILSAPKSNTLVSAATYGPSTRSIVQQQQDVLERLLKSTTVDGNVSIGQSDLGAFGPIAFLYNAMHLGGDVRKPTGHGDISFHMEDGQLHISNLYYFNRGIEVRGVANIGNMWAFPDSPLHGSVVGTARPLKNIKLPLFAEADAIITALQGTLTSVIFDHTVRNPGGYQLVSFAQLGGELKGILIGEVGSNNNSGGGGQ